MKKPDRKEFTTIAKVSAIGLILIGLIGYVISLIIEFIGIWWNFITNIFKITFNLGISAYLNASCFYVHIVF